MATQTDDTHTETGNARVRNPNALDSSSQLTDSLCSDRGVRCRNEQRQESGEPNTASSSNRNWEDEGARPKTDQTQRTLDPPLWPTLTLNPLPDGLSVDFIARRAEDETLRRSVKSDDRDLLSCACDATHTKCSLCQHEQKDNTAEVSNPTAPTDQEKAQDDVLRYKRVQTKSEVEVQRNNPSLPLHSVKSFEELPISEPLCRGLYNMGFNKPSKIQETALPMLLADPPKNIIAQSQSGTGKTTAFVLPMLSRVDETQNFTQVICLSPTYKQSLQTGQVAEKMRKFCPEIKIGYAVRGVRVSPGHKVTYHILFGTPGTMLDWIYKHKLVEPRKIKMFVLDEADVMIARQGHHDQAIRIHKKLTKDCQMLLFSATYDDEVMKLARSVVPDPIIIDLRREEEIRDNIKQYYVECQDEEDKLQALSNMYGVVPIGQCIVFCQTHKSASWLAEKMTAKGHSVALLSGEITVEQRLALLNRFRDGKARLLIATNVCARGIDVEQVTVVVNYDMPVEPSGKPDFETYQHRIDRIGRFGKNGIAVNFIDSSKALNIMKKIEKHFGRKISLLETNDVEELEKLN